MNRLLKMLLAIGIGLHTMTAVMAESPDFDRDIAPLLVRRCLDCHNASDKKGGLDLTQKESAFKGGESGVVVVPRKSAESLLWQHVRNGEMPPKKPLSKDEVELLRRWIDGGANWGRSPIDPFAFTTTGRAGYDWWSLQPIRRPTIPERRDPRTAWSNPIDSFIQAKLHQEGLSPSEPADRRTLLRRLSFDLIGLPPSPQEFTAFEADPSPQAIERVVNRLLDSPHFGERWARHWLDIIRFGESQGFERDKLRNNSWRFRDWIVNAFNRDMPYDQFVRSQLAGDVLHADDPNELIATGFLVAGAYDEVGQSQQSAAMRAIVRQDEMEDYVSTIGETFLGLTVHCARCHDHKFDPISSRDYYQIAAALAGVRPGDRDLPTGDAAWREAQRTIVSDLTRELDVVTQKLNGIEGTTRKEILAERRLRVDKKVPPPQPVARWEFNDDLKDSLGNLHGTAHGAKLKDGQLLVNGRLWYVATEPLAKPIREKTLEVWLRLDHLNQAGGGAITLQTLDGVTFDSIVFAERESNRWMAGSNGFARTQSFQAPEDQEADKQLVHVVITYDADGTITGYRNGQIYGQPYKSNGPVSFEAGKSQIVFGLRHAPAGGNRMLAAAIDRAALYDRALTAGEVAASAGVFTEAISEQELLARLPDELKSERTRLKFEAEHLRKQLGRANENRVYAIAPKSLEPTRLLLRGNPASPGEELPAAGITALNARSVEASESLSSFTLPLTATDADRRKALANWITDRRNPLFARVIVNRLWHYHFGVGIVDSPSDFGFSGGRPSHPELLDWLAAELIDNRWSLKHIHRLIVNSATYRQSSRPRLEAIQKDAGNRWLWRKSPARLDAETLRDAMLAHAGQLNRTVSGPGYHDFTTFTFNSQFYDILDPVGPSFHRRSLYRTWVRSGRNPFLEVLDCPDPSTKTPKRAVTTTPLQALSLLNNSFVLRMSDDLAARVRHEATAPEKQARAVYRQLFGRTVSDENLADQAEFIKVHGLPAFCRAMLNSNEFVIVD